VWATRGKRPSFGAAEARTCNDPVARQQFKVTKPAAGRDAEARDAIIRIAVHFVGRILPEAVISPAAHWQKPVVAEKSPVAA